MPVRVGFAREAARKVIKDVGISEPPVDVRELARKEGLDTYDYDFPDEISGVLVDDGEVRAIGVNKHHTLNRRRFTIAHELGHIALGHGHSLYVDIEDPGEDMSEDFDREANEFAAELLMPMGMIKKDVKEIGVDVQTLAKRYQVSEHALWIRLLDLGMV